MLVLLLLFHSAHNSELWFLFSEEYAEQPSELVSDCAPLLSKGPEEIEESSPTPHKVLIWEERIFSAVVMEYVLCMPDRLY